MIRYSRSHPCVGEHVLAISLGVESVGRRKDTTKQPSQWLVNQSTLPPAVKFLFHAPALVSLFQVGTAGGGVVYPFVV